MAIPGRTRPIVFHWENAAPEGLKAGSRLRVEKRFLRLGAGCDSLL